MPGVLVYSWWGQGSYEDNLAPRVLDAAARHGIKVAWHLEPYGGRTAASTVGRHQLHQQPLRQPPGLLPGRRARQPARVLRLRQPVIADWTAARRGDRQQHRAGADHRHVSKIAHFCGLYTYDVIAGATAPGWESAGAYAKAQRPDLGAVGRPRATSTTARCPATRRRRWAATNGATYDLEWTNALDPTKGGVPTWVSITSFNEWHEGSTIEPARSNPPAGFGYQTFDGAYGTHRRRRGDRLPGPDGVLGAGVRAAARRR